MTAYVQVIDNVVTQQLRPFDPARVADPDPPPPGPGPWFLLTSPIDWRSRPAPSSVLLWNDGAPAWHDPRSLAVARADKIEEMNVACNAQIVIGFDCSALGSPYRYPAKPQDQANLVASVTDSLLAGGDPDWRTPFWCYDDAGTWDYRPHTIAQIQQVGREGKATIMAALAKNEALRRQIEESSAEQLNDIHW